jgi:hypothetical protein
MAEQSNRGPPRVQNSDWVVGTLLEHGPAKYQFNDDNSLSYFAKIRTSESEQGARRRVQEAEQDARPIDGRGAQRTRTPDDGGIQTLWGTDLKRAIEQSKSGVKVGQVVAARVLRNERVHFAANSKVPLKDQQSAYRKVFEVETPSFVKQRHQFARRMNETSQGARRQGIDTPEAFALYLIHDGARRLAEQWYPNAEDQQKFLARVRNFFEVSPDRLTVIAETVAKLNQQKSTPAAKRPPQQPEAAAAARERNRDAPVRE